MKIIINEIPKLEKAFEMIVSGADGIGVSDEEKIDKKKELIFYLPPITTSVLTTKSVTPIKIISIAKELNVNTILFEGDIFLDDIALIKEKLPYMKFIKKINIENNDSIKKAIKYKKYVDAVLLNTDIMDKEKIIICQKIIDECDYVLLNAKITKDYFAFVKTLKPYGIVIDYEDNKKINDFIKALK